LPVERHPQWGAGLRGDHALAVEILQRDGGVTGERVIVRHDDDGPFVADRRDVEVVGDVHDPHHPDLALPTADQLADGHVLLRLVHRDDHPRVQPGERGHELRQWKPERADRHHVEVAREQTLHRRDRIGGGLHLPERASGRPEQCVTRGGGSHTAR
jgi:hypothetical protein